MKKKAPAKKQVPAKKPVKKATRGKLAKAKQKPGSKPDAEFGGPDDLDEGS